MLSHFDSDEEIAGADGPIDLEGTAQNPPHLLVSDLSIKNSTPVTIEVASVRPEEENLNVRAAIVHMVGDMVQSIGVIIAAVIIYIKPEWTIADPICTFLFSILVMFTTVPIFSDCMHFLMEVAPENISSVEVYNAIQEVSRADKVR